MEPIEKIKNQLRHIDDFPKSGIRFADITPLFLEPSIYNICIDLLTR